MFTFGEIRAFTSTEIQRMQAELARIDSLIAARSSDLASMKYNPLNYVLETQRDAMNRLENSLDQIVRIREQLEDTMGPTIDSGDTAKLQSWLALSAVIGDASDTANWRTQLQYSSTAETAANVASDTATDLKNKVGLPLGIVALAIGGLFLLVNFGRRR